MPPDRNAIAAALRQTLAWSKGEGYLEYTKHDALNSPLLAALTAGAWRLRRR